RGFAVVLRPGSQRRFMGGGVFHPARANFDCRNEIQVRRRHLLGFYAERLQQRHRLAKIITDFPADELIEVAAKNPGFHSRLILRTWSSIPLNPSACPNCKPPKPRRRRLAPPDRYLRCRSVPSETSNARRQDRTCTRGCPSRCR